jgi:PAS domain S-box-containing protein
MTGWQFTPYAAPLFVGSAVLLMVAALSWQRRAAPGAIYLLCVAVGLCCYALGYAFELGSVTLAQVRFWLKVEYLGAATAPPFYLMLTLAYLGYQRYLFALAHAPLLAIPALTLIFAWTNGQHELIWRHLAIDTSGSYTWTLFDPGAWYLAHAAYSLLMMVASLALLARAWRRASGPYRGQTGLLLLSVSIPLAVYLVYLASSIRLDLNPYGLVMGGFLTAIALFQYQLFEIVPVAREFALASMSDAVIVLDAQRRVVDLNAAAQALIRRRAMTFPLDAVLPDSLSAIARYIGDGPAQAEIEVTAGDGRRVLDLRVTPLVQRKGQFAGHVLLLHDITARVRQETELRKLSRAVEQSPSSVVITDLDGTIDYVNPKFTDLTGYTADEARGQTPRILKSGRTPPAVYQEMWSAITGGGEWRGEILNRKKNGALYWEHMTVSGVKDADGRITHYVAVKEDITARKAAEDEREQLINELDAFAHTVAHDLKSPLQGVVGYAAFVAEDYDTLDRSEVLRYLTIIEQYGYRMASIIDELLLLASVRRQDEVRIEPMDTKEIVRRVVQRLALIIEARAAEIALPNGEWPVARGYGPWVEEVWANYISNAIKYGGDPPRVELGATVQADGRVRFWARDNGPGIPPEQRHRLFAEFARLDHLRVEGHGLGLSIVRRIVTRLGGEVGVESAVGQGSVFSFTLPGENTHDA